MHAEEKLAEYRAKKRREEHGKNNLLRRFFGSSDKNVQVSEKSAGESLQKNLKTTKENEQSNPPPPAVVQETSLFTLPNLLKFLLWVVLFGLFVELEFGSIYFILTCFYIVFKNMGTGGRRPDEPSAYSVFNPNCERIDGTLTAEQFEKELKYGASSVGKS